MNSLTKHLNSLDDYSFKPDMESFKPYWVD